MHIRYIVLCWSHRIIGFAFFEPVMIIRASNLTKMVLPILAKSMRHVLLLCINIWTTNVIAWSLQMTGLQNWGKLTRTLNIVRISFTAGLVLRFVVPSVYPIFGLRYYVARPGHADRSGRISVFWYMAFRSIRFSNLREGSNSLDSSKNRTMSWKYACSKHRVRYELVKLSFPATIAPFRKSSITSDSSSWAVFKYDVMYLTQSITPYMISNNVVYDLHYWYIFVTFLPVLRFWVLRFVSWISRIKCIDLNAFMIVSFFSYKINA